MVVYAIDDRSSYTTAHAIVNYLLGKCKRSSAIILVANKSDLVRTRAVSSDGESIFGNGNLKEVRSLFALQPVLPVSARVNKLTATL